MPVNVLSKTTPRGKGPEPTIGFEKNPPLKKEVEENTKEADLAAQEIQDLWESQEIGITGWSGETGNRYSDPH